MLARFKPPTGLQARIRGILLLLCIWMLVLTTAMLVFGSSAAPQRKLLAVGGLVLLGFSEVTAYRRGRFPLGEQLFEALVIGLAAVTLGDFRSSLGLFFLPLFFRTMYGSMWDVGLTIAAFSGSYLAAGQLWPVLNQVPFASSTAELVNILVGLANTGVQMKLVSTALVRHERGAAREQSLARAGALLVAASDVAQLSRATLEATRSILGQTQLTRAALAISNSTGGVSVTAAGVGAELANHATVDLARIPPAFQVSAGSGQLAFDNSTAAELERALGFRLHPGVTTITALNTQDTLLGMLITETPKKLPSETAQSLATLASELALALDRVRLTNDLLRLTDELRQDIVRREALECELAHRAFHDSLTELPNRALLVERLQQALARGRRGRRRPGVVFIDLDDFKEVNDSLGHRLGDQLLIGVAQRLRAAIRPGDTAARFGGDEFVVLLEDLAHEDEAVQVVDRFLKRMQAAFVLEDHPVHVGASIGIALSRQPGAATADELLREADLAMYAAKKRGKHQYVAFDPALDIQPVERRTLAA